MKRGEVWTVAGGAAHGTRFGLLTSDEMKGLNRALFVFLGLSDTETEKG